MGRSATNFTPLKGHTNQSDEHCDLDIQPVYAPTDFVSGFDHAIVHGLVSSYHCCPFSIWFIATQVTYCNRVTGRYFIQMYRQISGFGDFHLTWLTAICSIVDCPKTA